MKLINLIFVFLAIISLSSCGGSDSKKKLKTDTAVTLSAEDLEKGASLYRAKCMNCHMKSGKGIEKFYPPLADSDYLRENLEESIYMVKFGSNKPIKVNGIKYNSLMPASGLTDKELVLVFNYILNSWGNDYGSISLEQVEAVKRK
ncbi:c-type cytochrome [Marinifilum caeruleilacunae]|uniref:Cytochrome c n=1 Tax=Marinifilum caeruleilacunae TaxID=2499076 RepID=A0ABX1WX29_9BACT|nr:cytochrome c [Marinifilum caeruleilacunae]NOU60454.1 cytochrome c [Marinifilum caeruleilacunae]